VKEKWMKEVPSKDVPEISGGETSTGSPLPTTVLPYPTYPQIPGGPIGPDDLPDPLGDGTFKQQL